MTTTRIGLPELIRQHQEQTGQSYRDIAKATELSLAKIGQLAKMEQPHEPRVETLQKLATGLRLPMSVVKRAALVSAGIDPGADDANDRTGALASKIAELPEDDIERLEIIVAALHRARRG